MSRSAKTADYPNCPPPAGQLADGAVIVNDLLLYWIHHGRVGVRSGCHRFDGNTVHFSDGSARTTTTSSGRPASTPRLPFLDEALVPRRKGTPLRYAAGIVPHGLDKLYYIGLSAPRGPQIPIYGIQSKVAARLMALHEQAGADGAGIAAYLGRLQAADDRIDIPRHLWDEQLADTNRLLDAFEATVRVTARTVYRISPTRTHPPPPQIS